MLARGELSTSNLQHPQPPALPSCKARTAAFPAVGCQRSSLQLDSLCAETLSGPHMMPAIIFTVWRQGPWLKHLACTLDMSLLESMGVTSPSGAVCRWELKFRAKYHGTAALELGLTPEQLMLLERYADGLRHGGSSAPPEVRPHASWQSACCTPPRHSCLCNASSKSCARSYLSSSQNVIAAQTQRSHVEREL